MARGVIRMWCCFESSVEPCQSGGFKSQTSSTHGYGTSIASHYDALQLESSQSLQVLGLIGVFVLSFPPWAPA